MEKEPLKKKDLLNLALCILFKLLLEYLYVVIISPHYEYMGLTLQYNALKHVESYLLVAASFFLLDRSSGKASAIFLQILYVLSIIPMLALYGLKDESRPALYLSIGSFLLTVVIVKAFPKIKNSAIILLVAGLILLGYGLQTGSIAGYFAALAAILVIGVLSGMISGASIFQIKYAKSLFLGLIVLITIISYGFLIRQNGLPSFSAFNFNLTYEVRATVAYRSFLAYLIPWQANVINMFLIAIFYIKKQYMKMMIPIGLQLLLFAITAHKSFLFSPFALLALFWILERFDLIQVMLSGLIAANIAAYFTYTLSVTPWGISLVTHRVLFMPAQIGFHYFDFFSKNELLHFSEGFIGRLFGIASPYTMSVFNLIGLVYFNRPDMHTNTWYIADAFSNGGIYALFAISCLFAIVLIAADSISKNYKIVVAALFMPMFSLTNISLLTSLFTNGLMVGILVIILYSGFDETMIDQGVWSKAIRCFQKTQSKKSITAPKELL
jgi:hypothetical protein